MRYDCKELGFHFEVKGDFVPLNERGMKELFGMSDDEIKSTLYVFIEIKDEQYTGRYFQMTLDGGYYPTAEDVKAGQDLCKENMLKLAPMVELVDESFISSNDVRKLVWKIAQTGGLLSQCYMAKNGHLFCVSAPITEKYDYMENLLMSVCISVVGQSKEDLEREEMQRIAMAFAREINKQNMQQNPLGDVESARKMFEDASKPMAQNPDLEERLEKARNLFEEAKKK